MTTRVTRYSEEYEERCFVAWYGAGRPIVHARIMEVIPVDEYGRKPSKDTLVGWRNSWQIRADDLDQRAIEKVESTLITKKAALLEKQAEDAFALAQHAHQFLISGTFDSSASAVQAYFQATKELRAVIGLSDLLQRLGQMNDEELMKEAMKRIAQAANAGQTIDGVIEESEEDASSNE